MGGRAFFVGCFDKIEFLCVNKAVVQIGEMGLPHVLNDKKCKQQKQDINKPFARV